MPAATVESESDLEQARDERRLGLATDVQTIPKGTMMYYRGYPFQIMEDVLAQSSISIARADDIETQMLHGPPH